jgi:N-acetyl-gamma-glutamylphosphate reductase
MNEKKEITGLFTTFKEVLTKVQADVTQGIELIRLRNQHDGMKKEIRNLFSELGEKVYSNYKNSVKTDDIIKGMSRDIDKIKTEMASLKIKITGLEEKTAQKIVSNPELQKTKEETSTKEVTLKKTAVKKKIED